MNNKKYDTICKTAVEFVKDATFGLKVKTEKESEQLLAYVFGVFGKIACTYDTNESVGTILQYHLMNSQNISESESKKKLSMYQEMAMRYYSEYRQAAEDLDDWSKSAVKPKGFFKKLVTS